jgi:hypothetical protein
LLAKQILESPAPLDKLRPELPTALVKAAAHAMVKSPSERPDARAFAAELAAARTPDALLTPAAVRRKKRWRRVRLFAVIGVTAAIALGFGYWVIVQLFRGFSGGTLPELSAMRSSIPEALMAEARADGSLLPGESVRYAFVPGGQPWNEGLLLTDSALVRRTPNGPRRHSGEHFNVNLYYNGKSRGLIITDSGATVPDTLYRSLSGAELGALTSALTLLNESRTKPAAPSPRQ